jgi:hypothetical protein
LSAFTVGSPDRVRESTRLGVCAQPLEQQGPPFRWKQSTLRVVCPVLFTGRRRKCH